MAKANRSAPSASDFPIGTVGTARPKKPSPARKIVLGIVLGLVALVVLIGGLAFWFVQRTMPTTSGSLTLDELTAPVTVARDSSGIPHITAANIDDLFTAQGYVQAQDRLWQMDFYRRVGAGRLSEVLGETTLQTDEFLRTIGMRRAAAKDLDALPEEYAQYLTDYANGVNAFIDTHLDSLPLEFTLLGYRPEHWTPLDSVTFGKVMAWNLSENMYIELTMADLQSKVGVDRAVQLFPPYPDGKATIVQASALPGNPGGSALLKPLDLAMRDSMEPGERGSNNWVIDGSLAADGHPLIANDPHLDVSNPSIWYAIGLRATDGSYDVAGMSFAGTPGVVAGHNPDIAWAVTNLGPDTQDLYVEKLDPEGHKDQYYYGTSWVPMEILNETIRVKGQEDVNILVRSTRHGPLLNDVFSDLKAPTSLRWTASLTGSLFRATMDLGRAKNWEEFHTALSYWDVAGQNFVYADKDGNIGYQATGRWPLRASGSGMTPVDGSSENYEWVGFVPYEQMPRVFNPPEHYIVTANNRVTTAATSGYATGWWYPWFRAERITQMLTAKDKLSVDDFKAMQMDTHDIVAQKFVSTIANLKSPDARTQQAIDLLKGWDGDTGRDSAAAALYEVAWTQVATNTFADELGPDLAAEYRDNAGRAEDQALYAILDQPNNIWWQNVNTTASESRDDILLLSLKQATEWLTTTLGDDMSAWKWGDIHQVTFGHPLGSVQPLDKLFNIGPFATSGDSNSVNRASFDPADPYSQTSHSSMRQISDSGDWTKTQVILAPGQSGQPFSKYWGDMAQDWLNGGYRTLPWTDEQISAAASGGVLTLNPPPAEGTPSVSPEPPAEPTQPDAEATPGGTP